MKSISNKLILLLLGFLCLTLVSCGEDFFEFFLKVATQLGDVLEITSVVRECKPPFGGLLLSLKYPKTVPSR